MDYQDYSRLKKRIVPSLRFNQEIYEDFISQHISGETIWLDAGCGRHILPVWRIEAERALVKAAKIALGCDVDESSLHEHATLTRRLVASLDDLPLQRESVDLVTCNMVVEHLHHPRKTFAECARVLKVGGRLIIHTPNAYSYFVLLSRLVPRGPKLRLVRMLDGRRDRDVFPTRYLANTPRKLRALMAECGLEEERFSLLASDAMLASVHPLLTALELLYIKMTMAPRFRLLRVSMLASFVKLSRIGPVA